MGKLFQIVRPLSLTDTNYAAYEYLIRWTGRDGADYIYMFYDVEYNIRVQNDIINDKNKDRIEAINLTEGASITLTASDLSLNDLQVIRQLMQNKFVTRLKKDGTVDRFAPDGNSFSFRLMDGRYEVSFTLILSSVALWK